MRTLELASAHLEFSFSLWPKGPSPAHQPFRHHYKILKTKQLSKKDLVLLIISPDALRSPEATVTPSLDLSTRGPRTYPHTLVCWHWPQDYLEPQSQQYKLRSHHTSGLAANLGLPKPTVGQSWILGYMIVDVRVPDLVFSCWWVELIPAQLAIESGVPKLNASLMLSRAGSQGRQLRRPGGLELMSACRWVNLGPRGFWG